MLSQRPINYLRICSYFTIFSLILSMQNNKSLLFSRTKNVPWHILAPSAVVYDFLPLRASAHPAGGFLSYRKAISYTIKKKQVLLPVRTCFLSKRQSFIPLCRKRILSPSRTGFFGSGAFGRSNAFLRVLVILALHSSQNLPVRIILPQDSHSIP